MRTLVLAVLATVISFPADAQPVCMPRDAAISSLADRYNETPKALGLTEYGGLLELMVSPSGSWTILITSPDGMACMFASGGQWEELASVETDERS